MQERQVALGKRVELRQKRLLIVAKCEALRDQLRRCLPLDEAADTLDRDMILQTALALEQSCGELDELNRKLKLLGQILGD